MKKIKSERWIIFFILYILFTAACSCVSLIFPAHQILVIQVWYQISVVVWIFSSYDGEIAYQASENK